MVVYRYASTKVVRVVIGGQRAADRQLEREDLAGRGRYSYVIETTDAAGNTSRSRRHSLRVL